MTEPKPCPHSGRPQGCWHVRHEREDFYDGTSRTVCGLRVDYQRVVGHPDDPGDACCERCLRAVHQ